MNSIKNIKYIASFFSLIMLMSSCNEEEFLNRYPLDRPNSANFFVGPESARAAVNACYEPWHRGNANMLYRDMTIHLDALTDDGYWRPVRAASIALEEWNITPTHENVKSWWRYPYVCINAANFALANIPQSTDESFTPEQQAPYLGEAAFYRAYSYQFLTMLYGDVPLYLDLAGSFDDFHLPRSPKDEVLAQVIADFTFAKENLKNQPIFPGAPSKPIAAAMLAKTYLILGDWINAEAAAREAIEIAEAAGKHLMDDFEAIWALENEGDSNPELLWYWGFVENDEFHGGNHAVQRLTRDLPAELKTAIDGDGWGYALPQRDLYDAFEAGDPRREYTIFAPGDDYKIYPGEDFSYRHQKLDENGDTLRWDVVYSAGDMVEYDYRWSPSGMNVRKIIRTVINLANVRWSGQDVPVMRMSELYLILAEALAEQGDAEAYTWVNKVRARPSVNMPPVNSGDLVEVVRHERRVELAFEGLRLFDLIRWSEIDDVFGDGTKVKRHFYSDFLPDNSLLKYDHPIGKLNLDPLFPIPQEEIDNNININSNNPGW